MAQERHCPECGAKLTHRAAEGLCPKCLMEGVVAGNSDSDDTQDPAMVIEGAGARIGRYELLELIGEGGMGLVYLAEQQEPVKRRIALKIIKPGMDSKEVIARFEAERQTLAVLDHPNIAHVFDAGMTETGRPYFVMEHVRGLSITEYSDERKLSVEERLKLFKEVCETVHHAHQKGIIHRDIKPSNILVSVHGDRAIPKIIDFGIAKAITQPLTDTTVFTYRGQLLGTPEYMSPEQVDLATQDIDTRSDIYSLGVLLYELLAGVLPFDREAFKRAGFAEIQKTIREQEPTTPSTRLTNLGEKATVIAEHRRTQLITLARCLHRELEWIPMKAMRKDRTRRYRSASELADDIENYLNGTPLIAGPESAVYRTRKFMRKHAGSVTTAALVAVAIILGLVASIIMGCRAEQARQQEEAARIQVEQALARAEKAERIAQEQRKLAEERAEAYRRAMYSNNLARAKEAIDEISFDRAQKLLDSCEPELRGWEWQYLKYISTDPCIKTFRGHSDEINSIDISPDGKRIASVSDDETVKIWDTATGSEVMILRGHNEKIRCVAFSPEGKRLVSGSQDGIIKIWDSIRGAEVMTLSGHKGWIGSIAFSPDGRHFASCGQDKTVKVWDAKSGAEVMTLRGHRNVIWGVSFSPDSKRIASCGSDKTVRIWDAANDKEVMTLHGHESAVVTVTFSPNGACIASSSTDDTIKIWDASTGDERMTLRGHRDDVDPVVFTPDGKKIVSGSDDRTIKVWDVTTGEALITLRGHESAISSLVFSPDGEQLFSASDDNMIKAWNPAIDRDVLKFHGANSTIFQVVFSPDGERIAASTGDGTVKLWDAVSGADIVTLHGHYWFVGALAFSPDGRQIVTGGYDRSVRIWSAATGAAEMNLVGHTDWIWSAAFSPDGKHIASAGRDETIKVWNTVTGKMELDLRGHKGAVYAVTFSPDGRQIISTGSDGSVRVWDAASGTALQVLLGHETWAVRDVSLSPDGRRIASCGEDKTVRVWDAATGEELMTLRGYEGDVYAVAFSPDGTRIVSGHEGRTVRIWDAETGIELINLYGYFSSNIRSIAFSPDSKNICVGGDDGNITLWESVEPAAGYEPRYIANSARILVDELYKEHSFYYEVLSRVRDLETIDQPIRRMAVQITNARLGQDSWKLFLQSRQVLRSPDHSETEYREALNKAEKAVSLEPDYFFYIANLAGAQYRVGAYEDALATLARADDNRPTLVRGPIVDGYRAMVLHKLGRDKEAKAVLRELRDGYGKEWFSHSDFGTSFLRIVIEVEKLFADEDRTLHAILGLIEENKLGEASELIEKARQSKDPDYVTRMEGAIKLLEALRNLE